MSDDVEGVGREEGAEPHVMGRKGFAERAFRPRGFAAMSPAKRREIAAKGGKAAHAQGKAHQFTSEEAREAGRAGGVAVSADRESMRERGRRGGVAASRDRKHMAEIAAKGGKAVSMDREHMAEMGRRSVEARRARKEPAA
jgi:general stress protein YciG